MTKYTSLAKLYDSFSFDADPQEWSAYIDVLLKEYKIAAGSRLLDMGCGTGRNTLQLYKSGYKMTALDSSAQMLEIAARRFADAGANIQIIEQDMSQMIIPSKFDAVVCINDGINYITDEKDLREVVFKTYEALQDRGAFFFDISSSSKLKSMHNESFFEENDDGLYIWNNEYNDNIQALTMEISLYSHIEDDLYEKTIETHIQKAHETEFIANLLSESGFGKIILYDCFTQDPPKRDSQRIQFIALK